MVNPVVKRLVVSYSLTDFVYSPCPSEFKRPLKMFKWNAVFE